jgi:hypothetical protein
MFKKLFRRPADATIAAVSEQLMLDTLRLTYADNQLMQLHCDRMQAAFNATR